MENSNEIFFKKTNSGALPVIPQRISALNRALLGNILINLNRSEVLFLEVNGVLGCKMFYNNTKKILLNANAEKFCMVNIWTYR